MSRIEAHDFGANGTHVAEMAGRSLVVMATGTFGGGTLAVKIYSDARAAYRTVAAFDAATTSAQEVFLGPGQRMQFELTGATAPSIEIDYWFV